VCRHETPKVAKRSNKRQKITKGEDIKQNTGELYSILSALKNYFAMFNLKDPAESHPTIAKMLSIWVKDDVPVLKSPTFEGDQIEDFCAYAENSEWHLVCKAIVLMMYLACAGRIGELSTILWEVVRQVEHEGRLVWMFSYLKEKQDGRPEKMESMLGDEISNMIFTLYTGIILLLRLFVLISVLLYVQIVSSLKTVMAGFLDTYVGILLEVACMQLARLSESTRLIKCRKQLLGGTIYRSRSFLLSTLLSYNCLENG